MRTIVNIALLSTISVCLATTACRTAAPSEAAEIHAQKSSTLIAWLNEEQLPEDENLTNQADDFLPNICNELVTRHQVHFLLDELNASNTPEANEWLVSDVLYHIDDRRIYDVFVQRLSDKENRESFYIALYLAERGNIAALATLNRHFYQYQVSSWEWAGACSTFGQYRYMPAVSNLVDCLNAASLNASGASCGALQEIFPGSPKTFYDPSEAEKYYKKRLNENTRISPADNTYYPITPADKRFLASVVDAIKRKDITWIANHMIYPLSITSSNGAQVVTTKEEFQTILSRDFTDSIRAKILDAAKQSLFKNWQGIMVGDGLIWFSEYSDNENGPWTYGIAAIGGFAFQSSGLTACERTNFATANGPPR
jgi:hypothetical protein